VTLLQLVIQRKRNITSYVLFISAGWSQYTMEFMHNMTGSTWLLFMELCTTVIAEFYMTTH